MQARRKTGLLDFDGRAGGFQILLHLLGVVLGHAFLHGATGLGEVLGFLQAQAGDGANGLDDFDLLVAGRLQDDGELGLLFDRQRRRPGRRGMTGAAAETPNFSSMAFTSSITSISDLAAMASTICSLDRDI
jgi:hypothetical protein